MRAAVRQAARSAGSAPTSSTRQPVVRARLLHASAARRQQQQQQQQNEGANEQQQQQQQQKKQQQEQAQDRTVEGRSPFKAFVDVLREEMQKSREWQQSVAQLEGEVSKAQDSEAMKRAKMMYERARLTTSIKENPRLAAAAEELRKAGISVGDAVTHTLKTMEESPVMQALNASARAVGSAALTASEPLRKTEAYKAVAAEITEALENAAVNTQHGGYVDKEVRRRRREQRLAKAGKGKAGLAARRPKVEENLDAGEAVVVHATANQEKKSRLSAFTPKPVRDALDSMSQAYAESENPFVLTLRGVTSTVGRWFDETETSKVTRWVKEMDPEFTTESFLRELREYIVPEVVDAYVNADQATLKEWCSEATFNVLMATLQGSVSPSLISESRVLDIRNLDIMSSKILENDLHVFVVAWRTQEVLAYRDIKTGQIAAGDEDRIQQVGYVAVFTRKEEELDNKVTGGWKIIDMARRAA
ncbi:hypothetical protein ACM66B_001816 [Microbotryomycetes sp. NB124-2]